MRRPVLSAPTLAHPGVTHQVAQVSVPEGAVRHHPIPGAATRPASDHTADSDPREGVTRRAAIGLGQLGRIEVGQPDLHPARASNPGKGLDAEAVAVADIDDRPAEGGPGAKLGGHAAPVGDAFARVGQGGGRGQQGEGECDGGDPEHGRTLARGSKR